MYSLSGVLTSCHSLQFSNCFLGTTVVAYLLSFILSWNHLLRIQSPDGDLNFFTSSTMNCSQESWAFRWLLQTLSSSSLADEPLGQFWVPSQTNASGTHVSGSQPMREQVWKEGLLHIAPGIEFFCQSRVKKKNVSDSSRVNKRWSWNQISKCRCIWLFKVCKQNPQLIFMYEAQLFLNYIVYLTSIKQESLYNKLCQQVHCQN